LNVSRSEIRVRIVSVARSKDTVSSTCCDLERIYCRNGCSACNV